MKEVHMTTKTTKIETVTKLIIRKSGATIEQIKEATGWKPHSVRAAISGLRKRGMTVLLSKTTKGENVYKSHGA